MVLSKTFGDSNLVIYMVFGDKTCFHIFCLFIVVLIKLSRHQCVFACFTSTIMRAFADLCKIKENHFKVQCIIGSSCILLFRYKNYDM